MAIYYCVENEYKKTPWCIEIISGLISEGKRRKLQLIKINSLDEIKRNDIADDSAVILIGSLKSWFHEHIAKVYKINLLPVVLSNTSFDYRIMDYCNVFSDIGSAIRKSVASAKESGKPNIALYGIYPDSGSDTLRKNVFLQLGGTKRDVYYNLGSLKGCFYSFFPSIQNYDTIICSNDFVAVSLITRLKKHNYDISRLYIISCTDGIMLESISPTVTAFSRNYNAYGRAALSAYELAKKNSDVSFVDVNIKSNLSVRETTPGIKICDYINSETEDDEKNCIGISDDPEFINIMKLEKVLRAGDAIDIKILGMISQNMTYENIADSLYISHSTVKYRVKNICKLAGVSNIKELINLVSKYYKI